MDRQLPSTMRAWQYTEAASGLEENLKLNTCAPLPSPEKDQHLVRILATSVNPVDYKPAEIGWVSRFMIPKPATPGVDFVGRIVQPGQGSDLGEGQLIFGRAGTSPFAGGGLADYAIVPTNGAVLLPHGLSPLDAAPIGVAGLIAYQSIVPFIRTGSRIFINGGSGGTGAFGIQIAKAKGAYVVTSCSTKNVDYCRQLGADEVLDYTNGPLLDQLNRTTSSKKLDHVVDNIGSQYELYWRSQEYTKPGAKYVLIAADINLRFFLLFLRTSLLPSFLGGGKRKLQPMFAQSNNKQLEEISSMMVQGKIGSVVQSQVQMNEVPEAYRKSKTGRARGKTVVLVAPENDEAWEK